MTMMTWPSYCCIVTLVAMSFLVNHACAQYTTTNDRGSEMSNCSLSCFDELLHMTDRLEGLQTNLDSIETVIAKIEKDFITLAVKVP